MSVSCLFTSLAPSPPLFPLAQSLSLSHAVLSLWHSEHKDGDVLASRYLNVKTEAETYTLLP